MPYETPLGAFPSWDEAAAACEAADLDPTLTIEHQPERCPVCGGTSQHLGRMGSTSVNRCEDCGITFNT